MDWLRMYWVLVGSSLRAKLAYRLNFTLSLCFQIILNLSELAAVLLIVNRVHDIVGWTVDDLVFLYGLVATSGGVYRIFASELNDFDKYLVDGQFDAILVRPAPTLLTLVSRSVDVEHAGQFIQGIIVLLVSMARLSHRIGMKPVSILEVMVGVACGSVIWFAIVLFTATLGFWTTRVNDLQPVLMYGPEAASNYPLSIYPRLIRSVFYSVLPIAFGSYIPASIVLHKGVPPTALVGCAVVSVTAVCVSVGFWNIGIRHYTSTGT